MIAVFENSLDGASKEDIENLADFLATQEPSLLQTVKAARALPQRHQLTTLRHIVTKVIDSLFRASEEETTVHVSTCDRQPGMSDSQKVDIALLKTQQEIEKIPDETWTKNAAAAGMSEKAFREKAWTTLYYGFLQQLS